MTDENFDTTMSDTGLKAWLAFKNIVNNFLPNHQHPNYKNIVANLLDKYKKFG